MPPPKPLPTNGDCPRPRTSRQSPPNRRRKANVRGFFMNCATHPETPATAYCRSCGKPLCEICKRVSAGTIFCEEHAPNAAAQAGPYSQPAYTPPAVADPSSSPGLALFLGFIPGVGAIYNGQYAKGLIHAIIFGML